MPIFTQNSFQKSKFSVSAARKKTKTLRPCASAFIKNKRRDAEAQRIYGICDIRVAFAQFALKISVPESFSGTLFYFCGNALRFFERQ